MPRDSRVHFLTVSRLGRTSIPSGVSRIPAAQAPAYAQVMSELRSGRKRSHWMWFIFPQIAGLGHSAMAPRDSGRS